MKYEFNSDISEEEQEEIYDEYIGLPTKYDIDEYSMMEDFIETIEDERLYNQLLISIHGKGAFRRFKDTCINFGIIDDWYKFRDKKYKDIAIKWCEENNIEFYQMDKDELHKKLSGLSIDKINDFDKFYD